MNYVDWCLICSLPLLIVLLSIIVYYIIHPCNRNDVRSHEVSYVELYGDPPPPKAVPTVAPDRVKPLSLSSRQDQLRLPLLVQFPA